MLSFHDDSYNYGVELAIKTNILIFVHFLSNTFSDEADILTSLSSMKNVTYAGYFIQRREDITTVSVPIQCTGKLLRI